ncbi:MAG: hypothetical protein K2X93_19360 [Candidatus Obscuribacterales bacterium]|nr:hypothetical protein [Candidatus Obscuribacterales bacterium]
MKNYLAKVLKRLVYTLAAFVAWCGMVTLPVYAWEPPVHYFVSKNGDNSDGKSWETAWHEMDQIKWQQMKPFDDLTIDGGASKMVYRTPLRAALPWYNHDFEFRTDFNIRVSTETGHNGQAIILGDGQPCAGIELSSGNPYISGMRRSGLIIRGWGLDGVLISGIHSGPGNLKLENLELSDNKRSGLLQNGGKVILRSSLVHDNGTNLLVNRNSPNSEPTYSGFEKCWIYNSSYRDSDGIDLGFDYGSRNQPGCRVRQCVIGPGLRNGLLHRGSTSDVGLDLRDCLFINATTKNIATAGGFSSSNVTSFMTKANPKDESHDCFYIESDKRQDSSNSFSLRSSIFYGGVVRVAPGTKITTDRNTQYHTTGNTAVLGDSMVDPKFRSDVASFGNQIPVKELIHADFALSNESPARGTGSSITSVAQLLQMF